jgi:nucleolar pre-ribosomal-associated protein 1
MVCWALDALRSPLLIVIGLQSFKVFLDGLSSPDGDHTEQRTILNEYLASVKPREDAETPVYLADIMETWSLAGQTNNDNVLSAVPVVLALLLRLLSQSLEQVPYGLGICRTLLLKRQQELISRNLSADKGKEFIISPTLRLVREALIFDGGAVAKPVFRARNYTFKSLGRNMGIKYLGEGREDPKRPSARTNAVRLFLSALQFLHAEAKKELLSQRDIGAGVTRSIRDDPPYLVHEILETLKSQVLLDEKIPKEAKGRFLNANALTRIASLYNYDGSANDVEVGGRSVDEVAHGFLQIACTLPSAGVLRQQSGFYPKGTEGDDEALLRLRNTEDGGLENVVWMNKFREEIPVRNYALSEFNQGLRPWSNIKQSELLIAIFNSAPELIADYFQKKKTFTFEPKLSATWIGYAALMFNAVSVEMPQWFGLASGYSHFPPPTSIVLDNILPPALNQKVLVKCLTQKSNLVSFFATRILVLAVEKLSKTLQRYQEAANENKPLWKEASRRLIDEFCQRSPSMKDIVNSYRSISENDLLHRETASRLLLRYYEVLPQLALIAKFDVSPFLVTCVKRLKGEAQEAEENQKDEEEERDSRDRALGLRELEHLLVIAGHSPGMRWFAKLEELALSPYLTLLQLVVDTEQGLSSEKLLDSVNFVAEEQQLVMPRSSGRGLAPLVESLRKLKSAKQPTGHTSIAAVWTFLDNCVTRCATSPIKYLEQMLDLVDDSIEHTADVPRISPLTMTLLEQLPFVLKSSDKETTAHVAEFISCYMAFSYAAGEDFALLQSVFGKLKAQFPEYIQADLLSVIRKGGVELEADDGTAHGDDSVMDVDEPAAFQGFANDSTPAAGKSLEELFPHAVSPALDNSALSRWTNKTADDIIDDGHATALISLLASEEISIRKEALINILKMAAKIQQSDYDEKEQCWLLLSELAETAKGNIDAIPLPSPIVSFATHALEVLKNPLHTIYAKINTFLTAGPIWKLVKIPLMHEILQEEPAEDDGYYAEISFLVPYLLDGLRTPTDLALFHRKRVFERLMSLAGNPYMRTNLRKDILGVLYRATCIEGGSGTLITRFGVMAWLESRERDAQDAGDGEAWIYRAMMRRVLDTADKERVMAWSRGGILEVMDV